MTFDYDLFVIGGGSGGVRAARIAASEGGAKVALAEEFRMGGTCVIRGCVPKKLMVFASGFSQMMEDGKSYGWDIRQNGFDWPKFKTHLETELDRLEAAYRRNAQNAGVTIYDSRAVLKDAHTVVLADGQTVSAKHILIATGGYPFVPDLPGRDLAMTSNEIFLQEELPKSILIVGGGYIACEFACILNGLGVEVTQFYRGAQILNGFDEEVRGHIGESMIDSGVSLSLGCDVMEMEQQDQGIWVKATSGKDRHYDAVLYATGRMPNTTGLGLEDLGVKLGRRGEILVDEWSQTSVPSIYAVGDVTDRINLTPVAIREGHAFADTVFGGKKVKADHTCVPGAVFTQPEYGYVGMTEEEARKDHSIEVYATAFKPMKTAFAGRSDRVLFKLIVDAETRKVLGCHIVAEGAAELIQLAAIAVKMGATKENFDRTVAVHPTIAEELVTMRTPVRTA
ncbi:glutathione-disulfide reductase [Oceaniglobus ichthyenteri]|uniref:glutathione-disulfide reductase n=1 Tax=Oceaniglobus ichthyenteri TaxID=2136177 RepID=UPI000D36B7B9|nr:glutathione-disulfide reductase [Oceaniglobus ichthyenteri]